jgi:hypothetical protein
MSVVSAASLRGVAFWRVMGVGLVLWAGFLVPLRLGEGIGLLAGWFKVASFALAVPAMAVTTWAVQRVMGWPRAGLTGLIALVLAPATLADGVVFGFAPWLYGADPAHQRAAAGIILWGVGVSILTAWRIERGDGRTP